MTWHDAFDGILAALQEAAFDDDRWPEAAALIDEACRIKGNALVYGRGTSLDDSVIYLARLYFRGERNEEIERKYFKDYCAQDECLPRIRALPDSRLTHISDLYTEEEEKTSVVYNEFLPLSDMQNCLRARMDGPNGSRIVWAFCDPVAADDWTYDQTDTIRRLLPHLRQFVRIRQVLADMNGLKASLSTLLDHGATGVIQLNRQGRIVAMNDRARDIVKGRKGLLERDGFLCARAAEDNDNLQGLLSRALPRNGVRGVGGFMVVHGQARLSRVVLHVTPVGTSRGGVPPWDVAALVLLVDPFGPLSVDRAMVEEVLGLLPAEGRIAVLLAEGKSVREISEETGRSENTIRWHIRQIFEKQGLTRIGQLAPLVRSLSGHSGAGFSGGGGGSSGARGRGGVRARGTKSPTAKGDADGEKD